MSEINKADLEDWAHMAAKLIQEYIADAEASAGGLFEKSAETEKSMIHQYELIKKGLPTWQASMQDENAVRIIL